MTLEFDLDVGALYIRLTRERVARTREFGDNANVDLDAAGKVVGIEVTSAAHHWPLTDILAAYKLNPADVAQLRAYFLPTSTAPSLQDAPPVVSAELRAPTEVPVAA